MHVCSHIAKVYVVNICSFSVYLFTVTVWLTSDLRRLVWRWESTGSFVLACASVWQCFYMPLQPCFRNGVPQLVSLFQLHIWIFHCSLLGNTGGFPHSFPIRCRIIYLLLNTFCVCPIGRKISSGHMSVGGRLKSPSPLRDAADLLPAQCDRLLNVRLNVLWLFWNLSAAWVMDAE